jgi:hypothetical protein
LSIADDAATADKNSRATIPMVDIDRVLDRARDKRK